MKDRAQRYLVQESFEGMPQNCLLGAKVESGDQNHFLGVVADSDRQEDSQKSGVKSRIRQLDIVRFNRWGEALLT